MHSVLHAKHFAPRPKITIDVAKLREHTRAEQEIEIDYTDAKGIISKRAIWPLSILSTDGKLVVISFCQLRQDYRALRMERLVAFAPTGISYTPKRVPMLREAIKAVSQQP